METVEPLLTISASLLGIGLTAKTAISQYFKQREYELVLERYLSGSVDLLASSLEVQMQNYNYNWARALMVVKQLRDFKDDFDITKVDSTLKPLEVSEFNIIAQYRLGEIVGSQTMWEVYQLAFAFLQSSNAFITDDLFMVLKNRHENKLTEKERSDIVQMATDILKKQNDDIGKYIIFLKNFHDIGKLLETQKLTFKKIREIRNNELIKSINSSLEENFKGKLGKYK